MSFVRDQGGTSGPIDLTTDVTGVLPAANAPVAWTNGTWSITGAWAPTATGAVTLTAGDTFTIAAGGTNKNVVLTPSGTGVVTSAKKMTLTNGTAATTASTGTLVLNGGIATDNQSFFAIVQCAGQLVLGVNANTSLLYCQSANIIQILDGGFTGTGDLNFGPLTSSFVRLKRNGAVLETKLGDNSGYAAHKALYYQGTSFTVNTLPAAATAGAGARAFVTDANSSTFNATATTGGANAVPVFSDGSAWKIG